MLKIKGEEGHYTIKRVRKLPKRGNSNLLYMIKTEDRENEIVDKLYRFLSNGEWQELSLGSDSGGTTSILTDNEDGTYTHNDGYGTLTTLTTATLTGNTVSFSDTQTITIPNESTGLEAIDEGNGIGWRLIGRDPDNYGSIGYESIDVSNEDSASTTSGATGVNSFTSGYKTTASGQISTAMGRQVVASGNESFALSYRGSATADGSGIFAGDFNNAIGIQSTVLGGVYNTATGVRSIILGGQNNNALFDYNLISGSFNSGNSVNETVIGVGATNYTSSDPNVFNIGDRLFTLGASVDFGVTKKDALTVLKNGDTAIGIDNFEANTSGDKLQVNGKIKANSINFTGLPTYADEASASSLETGDMYQTATGEIRIKL